jgi:hypothetical protein
MDESAGDMGQRRTVGVGFEDIYGECMVMEEGWRGYEGYEGDEALYSVYLRDTGQSLVLNSNNLSNQRYLAEVLPSSDTQ